MKTLKFTDQEGSISVSYPATLKDPSNLNEQFYVQNSRDMTTYRELQLFYYWVRGVAWTLNEMVFFAINNNLCLKIFDEASALVASYGACGDSQDVFTDEFSDEFA